MFDITGKIITRREATARAALKVSPTTLQAIRNGSVPKGDPIPIAKVAAIQAAKSTFQIIPYCHPIPVEAVNVVFELEPDQITATVEIKTIYKTGVEIEALTAASVAVLTLYDMMKQIDDSMEILGVRLLKKSGGKSEFKEEFKTPLRAAVLVMSDAVSSGVKEDISGRLIVDRLEAMDLQVLEYKIIPDDIEQIQQTLYRWADDDKMDLVMTTGGTGFSPRDSTPEAITPILEREIPGIPEALRAYGQQRTPYSMLSRCIAGIRGNTIIVTLPGSKSGVSESLDMLFPSVLHSFKMLWGGGHKPDSQ